MAGPSSVFSCLGFDHFVQIKIFPIGYLWFYLVKLINSCQVRVCINF